MVLAQNLKGRELLQAHWNGELPALIELLNEESLVPLARSILADPRRDPSEVSLVLFQSVVLNRLTVSLPGQRACLLAVADVARRLSISHKGSLLARCMAILARPFDPYATSAMAIAARWAASSLLIADSSLDQAVLHELRGSYANKQALLDILGGAIRARETDRPESVAAVLEASRPNSEEARSFCSLCDTGFSSLEPVLRGGLKAGRHARFAPIASGVRHVVPYLLGPAVVFAILTTRESSKLSDGPYVGTGVATGALALLLATHVVSAQLSAERLPGSLARFTSQPWSVEAGYSAGFTMVAAALLAHSYPGNHAWQQIATLGLLLFAVCLVATLITLVRRTDLTTAAVGFARDQGNRFRSSGAKMGFIQAEAFRADELLKSLPWARYGGSEPLNQRREPIRASANGFSALRRSALEKVAERSPWQARELTLHVGGGLGTLVHRDKEIASIVPGREVALTQAELAAVRRAFRVHSEARVEECAESLTVLAVLSGRLAAEGNPGGSNRVCDALIDLLSSHLTACHQRRREGATDAEQVYPVNLALQSVIAVAVARTGNAETGQERRAMALIVRRVLSICIAGDGAIAMVGTALPSAEQRDLQPEELELLWETGARAIELGSTLQGSLVEGDLERRMKVAEKTFTTPMEIAARLTMLNIWADQHSAGPKWEWFWEKSDIAQQPNERTLSAIRIGAAALLAGCASVALEVSLALKGTNCSQWRAYVQTERVRVWEQFLSTQYGYLLDADPGQAMVAFLDFVERVNEAVH